MKKIATWLFATVGGIVLLFSYKTSTEALPSAPVVRADASVAAPSDASVAASPPSAGSSPAASGGSSPAASTGPSSAASTGPSSAASGGSSSAATGLLDGTYTGARQETKYGPVQVLVNVAGGRVTGAVATVFPSGKPRTDEVNADAIPRLQAETVGTVDGRIDMVTGATFTSTGYIGSLQEAIDQARP